MPDRPLVNSVWRGYNTRMSKTAIHRFTLCVYVFCFWMVPFPDALYIMLPMAVLRDYLLYIDPL